MAELLGLVASVIQVAGTGLKISRELYQYADGVANADRRIKDIAKEVEITSFVIKELGNVFGQDETSAVISADAIRTGKEAMKECSDVFAEIDKTLKKSKSGKMGRLMLPFRDNKIELLRTHIDKLKAALQLLMSVLTFAHQVASRKLDRAAEAKHREEIKQLLERKKRSTKNYEESLRNLSISGSSTLIDNEGELIESESSESKSLGSVSDPDFHEQETKSMQSTSVHMQSIPSTITVDALAKCVVHVRQLLDHIEILQQSLTEGDHGDAHAKHHENLMGSYLLTRSQLDTVIGGSRPKLAALSYSSISNSTKEASLRPDPQLGSSRSQIVDLREAFVPDDLPTLTADTDRENQRHQKSPGRSIRGRKKALTYEQRSEARTMRAIGSCSNCKRRKTKCDPGTPCQSCREYFKKDLIYYPCEGRLKTTDGQQKEEEPEGNRHIGLSQFGFQDNRIQAPVRPEDRESDPSPVYAFVRKRGHSRRSSSTVSGEERTVTLQDMLSRPNSPREKTPRSSGRISQSPVGRYPRESMHLDSRITIPGCFSCRKHRIRCDEGRPDCANCVREKRHCEGYDQHYVLKSPGRNEYARMEMSVIDSSPLTDSEGTRYERELEKDAILREKLAMHKEKMLYGEIREKGRVEESTQDPEAGKIANKKKSRGRNMRVGSPEVTENTAKESFQGMGPPAPAPFQSTDTCPSSQHQGNFDISFNFRHEIGNEAGVLENFDFDSFLYTGDDNKDFAQSNSIPDFDEDIIMFAPPSIEARLSPSETEKEQSPSVIEPQEGSIPFSRSPVPIQAPDASLQHTLQDYSTQLMLLEMQNKKRLLIARQEQDSMGLSDKLDTGSNTDPHTTLSLPTEEVTNPQGTMQYPFNVPVSLPGTSLLPPPPPPPSAGELTLEPPATQPGRRSKRTRSTSKNVTSSIPEGIPAQPIEIIGPNPKAQTHPTPSPLPSKEDDDEVDALLREWTNVLG